MLPGSTGQFYCNIQFTQGRVRSIITLRLRNDTIVQLVYTRLKLVVVVVVLLHNYWYTHLVYRSLQLSGNPRYITHRWHNFVTTAVKSLILKSRMFSKTGQGKLTSTREAQGGATSGRRRRRRRQQIRPRIHIDMVEVFCVRFGDPYDTTHDAHC